RDVTDAERFKLLHGPYRPPRCRVGGWLTCEVRGRVQVKAISDGRIPCPMTKAGGHLVLVICGGLARATRREPALAVRHWFGPSCGPSGSGARRSACPPTTPGRPGCARRGAGGPDRGGPGQGPGRREHPRGEREEGRVAPGPAGPPERPRRPGG